jgi:hypothetical protein
MKKIEDYRFGDVALQNEFCVEHTIETIYRRNTTPATVTAAIGTTILRTMSELDVSDSANFNSLSAALALHPSSWGFTGSGSGTGSDPLPLLPPYPLFDPLPLLPYDSGSGSGSGAGFPHGSSGSDQPGSGSGH